MRYHKQCISPGNVLYGTTTSPFHLAICYAVPRPVQPSNMSYGITTSVFHLTMCHTVPQPVYFTWQCDMRYHDQCLSPGNVLVRYQDQCNLAICLTVPQPVNCTWQCVIRYHNQCISADNVLFGTTTSVFHLPMCYAVPQMKKLLRISWPRWAWKWTCSSSKDQAQASDQFLATTKLATNRAICLKTKNK